MQKSALIIIDLQAFIKKLAKNADKKQVCELK